MVKIQQKFLQRIQSTIFPLKTGCDQYAVMTRVNVVLSFL